MVARKDIEVRVVSSSDGRQFVEYENPKPITSTNNQWWQSEKFIEAITDAAYHIEVYIQPNFKLHGADGIKIGLKIDGGDVVGHSKYYDRESVVQKQRTGLPVIDDRVRIHQASGQGPRWHKSKYSFGSLKIGKSRE